MIYPQLRLVLIHGLCSFIGVSSPASAGQFRTLMSTTEVEAIINSASGSWLRLNGPEDSRQIVPCFVTGDFNGDGFLDLAAIVRINRAFGLESDRRSAPFLIRKPPVTSSDTSVHKNQGPRFADLLARHWTGPILFIVHGSSKGPDQRRGLKSGKFAMIDFMDYVATTMLVSRTPLRLGVAGDSPELSSPKLLGDAIRFVDSKGEGTAIYWNGSEYRWHPLMRE